MIAFSRKKKKIHPKEHNTITVKENEQNAWQVSENALYSTAAVTTTPRLHNNGVYGCVKSERTVHNNPVYESNSDHEI